MAATARRPQQTVCRAPQIFTDWDSHYGEYKDILRNYKHNYSALKGENIEEEYQENNAVEREMKPYQIMADYSTILAKQERKPLDYSILDLKRSQARLGESLRLSDGERPHLINNKHQDNEEHLFRAAELQQQQEERAGEGRLFVNRELNALFGGEKEAADTLEVLSRNRQKTRATTAQPLTEDTLNTFREQEDGNKQRERLAEEMLEKKTLDFVDKFRDNADRWKIIDPFAERGADRIVEFYPDDPQHNTYDLIDSDAFLNLDFQQVNQGIGQKQINDFTEDSYNIMDSPQYINIMTTRL